MYFRPRPSLLALAAIVATGGLACSSPATTPAVTSATAPVAAPAATPAEKAPAEKAPAEKAPAPQPLLANGFYSVLVQPVGDSGGYEVGLSITNDKEAEITSYFNADAAFPWSGTIYAEGVASPEGTKFLYRSHVNVAGEKSEPPGATQDTVLFTVKKDGEALKTSWGVLTYPGKADVAGFQVAERDIVGP